MKTKTLYICEKCGWKYDNEPDCLKCEATHQEAQTIESQNFDKKYGDSAKYPGEIIMNMANGHKIIYRFYKPIVTP